MTDARLRGEWLTAPSHDGLTDAAYRVLHNALMHCAEQGTDGAISRRELRFLYPTPIEQATLDELERAGFWTATAEGGYQLEGWSTDLGQSTAAEVEEYRRNARERQRKRRAAQKSTQDANRRTDGARPEVVTRDVTRDNLRDVTGYVGKARLGLSLPDDLTEPIERQSLPTAALESTDTRPTPMTERLGAQQGITSIPAVVAAIARHTGHTVTPEEALQVSLWILGKKPGRPPGAPQRYVTGSIARSPFEVQRFIHEREAS